MPAKVYVLNTADEEHSGHNYEVPSMEFLMETLADIENTLTQHIKDTGLHNDSGSFNGFSTIQYINEELPVSEEITTIRAENVQTDTRHMFVTKQQISDFRSKPDMEDINVKFEDVKNNLKSYFYNLYVQLLNMPDAVNKLKAISNMLKEDTELDALITTMSSNSDMALEDHITDGSHLSAQDRKTINSIESALKDGIDWNAEDGIFISNKPDAIKANGGNADTVGGLSVDKLATRRDYDIYIGVESGKYDSNDVDIYFRKNEDIAIILDVSASFFFRKGTYNTRSFNISTTKGVTITGSDDLTEIIFIDNAEPMIIPDNCAIKNIKFTNGVIEINSNCKLNNVTFENCNISLNRAHNTTIENCNIIGRDTTYKYIGSCFNNFIIHNRISMFCKRTVNYHGSNNIIEGNLFV